MRKLMNKCIRLAVTMISVQIISGAEICGGDCDPFCLLPNFYNCD